MAVGSSLRSRHLRSAGPKRWQASGVDRAFILSASFQFHLHLLSTLTLSPLCSLLCPLLYTWLYAERIGSLGIPASSDGLPVLHRSTYNGGLAHVCVCVCVCV